MNTSINQPMLPGCRRAARLLRSLKNIADITYRMDHRRHAPIEADLPAQMADVHVDHVGLRIEVVVPDRLEQERASDDLARVPHQEFKQTVFARLQVER